MKNNYESMNFEIWYLNEKFIISRSCLGFSILIKQLAVVTKMYLHFYIPFKLQVSKDKGHDLLA